MKNVITLIVCFLLAFSVEAQKAKKPNINKAKTLWSQGKLDEAKAIIDAATEYEKTMGVGKTWYYRGLIYASIDTTSNEVFQQLSENPMQEALSSFNKAVAIDGEDAVFSVTPTGGFVPVLLEQQLSDYYGYYFTKAAKLYEEDQMAESSEYFELAGRIQPKDTASVINAAVTAQAVDQNERAINFFVKAIELGARAEANYYNVILDLNDKEDFQGVLDWVRIAKEVHPDDIYLGRFEVTALLSLDKQDEAAEMLLESIKKEPNDVSLKFSLALLYDEAGENDKALSLYLEALEIDPNHYASNFNIAVMKFSDANELYKELTQLTTSAADRKTEQKLLPQIKEGFNGSLPYWEKAYEIKSDDVSAIQTLAFVYDFLKMKEKADKINKILDDME